MRDIIDRLLAAVKAAAPIQLALVVSAAAEIERLRFAIRRLAEQDATLSVCEGDVTVQIDGTLTDAEREAVVRAWHGLLKLVAFEKQLADVHLADARTINALLARTKNGWRQGM